jgi:hypothetical protein
MMQMSDEDEEEIDPYLGTNDIASLMQRDDIDPNAHAARGMGSRKMNWDRVLKENKLASNQAPKLTVDDGRLELGPETKRPERLNISVDPQTLARLGDINKDLADVVRMITADPECDAIIKAVSNKKRS